jgi:hypothetical protein
MAHRLSTLALVAVALTTVTVLRAELLPAQAPPLELTRLTLPIRVDGVPDEPAWQQVPTLPLTMYAPVFRGTPTQRTEIRVAYDDEFLYAAGWFYDSDASGIRINSLYRDRWNGDDAFAIYVDAFNDKRNAKWFGTTPGGIRFETLIFDDGATMNGNAEAGANAEGSVRPTRLRPATSRRTATALCRRSTQIPQGAGELLLPAR